MREKQQEVSAPYVRADPSRAPPSIGRVPLDAGTANTYGGRYEARWTAHCAMLVLEERASTIFPEPPGDEAAGFEFTLTTPAYTEYHQVKRQRTAMVGGRSPRWRAPAF